MEIWLERVKKSIFPRSSEKEDILKALAEWHYTGDTYDLETPRDSCELCGHPEIRYQFTIRNRNTYCELEIGSECITRFDIPAVDKKGGILSSRETRKVVTKDRRKLINDAKKRRVVLALIQLKQKEQKVQIDFDDLVNYFLERGAFTPKQLNFILWRLEVNAIEFHLGDFNLTIRRKREKYQLLYLEEFQIKKVWPCLSDTQKRYYNENKI